MWKRIYRINWDGGLECRGKAGIQRGSCNQLPKPLLRHQMEVETCVFGGVCEPPLHTGAVGEGVGEKW